MLVVLGPAVGPAVGGEELRIEFTLTNEAPKPAFSVTLKFEVTEPNRLVIARTAHGSCAEAVCDLGSLDGYESVTGHVIVLSTLGFNIRVRVDADVSWLLNNSNRRHSYAHVTVPLTDSNQPGALIWATATSASGMGCDDGVEVGPEAVYAAFSEEFYAVSRSSGKVLWSEHRDS